MSKRYRNSVKEADNLYELNLCKNDGSLEDLYIIDENGLEEKINLSDLVNLHLKECHMRYCDIDMININYECYNEIVSNNKFSVNLNIGNDCKNASAGCHTKNITDSDCFRNASTGDHTINTIIGYLARNASTGDRTINNITGEGVRTISCGDNNTDIITGVNGVIFSCGRDSVVKGSNGTWISLCEYKCDNNPSFALSAQIGNSDYKDVFGNTLSEDEYYTLHHKQFCPVIIYDGLLLFKKNIKSKIINGIEIMKCNTYDGYDLFCCIRNGLVSHGPTIRDTIDDLIYKELKKTNISDMVKNIKSKGYVTRNDYRIITGACQFGIDEFCKDKDILDLEQIELSKLLEILDDRYFGAREFKELFKED